MAILSGEIVTGGRLGRMQPVPRIANQSGQLTVTATITDIPGCSITLTTTAANAIYVAHGVFDFDLSGAQTGTGLGYLDVDGSQQTKQARYAGEVTTDTSTVAQQWQGTLASAGSHTLKLRANGPATNMVVFSNSSLHVVIYEVV